MRGQAGRFGDGADDQVASREHSTQRRSMPLTTAFFTLTVPLKHPHHVGERIGRVVGVIASCVGTTVALVEIARTGNVGVRRPGVGREPALIRELPRRLVLEVAGVDRVPVEGVAEQLRCRRG